MLSAYLSASHHFYVENGKQRIFRCLLELITFKMASLSSSVVIIMKLLSSQRTKKSSKNSEIFAVDIRASNKRKYSFSRFSRDNGFFTSIHTNVGWKNVLIKFNILIVVPGGLPYHCWKQETGILSNFFYCFRDKPCHVQLKSCNLTSRMMFFLRII